MPKRFPLHIKVICSPVPVQVRICGWDRVRYRGKISFGLTRSLNNLPDPTMPVIYLNHYPQDSSQNNWYDAIDRLKMKNVQLILHGHGHNNRRFTYDGIPAVMGRSNLRAKDSIGGYNIVTFANDSAVFELRRPVVQTQERWLAVALKDQHFSGDTRRYFRPDFTVNNKYPNVKQVWKFQDKSDVGAGTAMAGKLIFATNTSGHIYALDKDTGKTEMVVCYGRQNLFYSGGSKRAGWLPGHPIILYTAFRLCTGN